MEARMCQKRKPPPLPPRLLQWSIRTCLACSEGDQKVLRLCDKRDGASRPQVIHERGAAQGLEGVSCSPSELRR